MRSREYWGNPTPRQSRSISRPRGDGHPLASSSQFPDGRRCAVQAPIDVRFDWELGQWGLVMRKRFPGGPLGPNRYPHCKVSDSGHLCFWDTKLAMWVPMFRLTNAQLFEWMKSIKVLDAELR
jgi:hypothetical protein